jgi:hypothetical protein
VQQHRKVAHFLGNLVRHDREGRHDAQVKVRQKCRGDQHAINKIVQAVTHHGEPPRGLSTVVFVGMSSLHGLSVTVAPKEKFFEHKEKCDTAKQRDADTVDPKRPGARHRVGNEREQRRGEQRPGRETHAVGHEPVSALGGEQQEDASDQGRKQPTECGE